MGSFAPDPHTSALHACRNRFVAYQDIRIIDRLLLMSADRPLTCKFQSCDIFNILNFKQLLFTHYS